MWAQASGYLTALLVQPHSAWTEWDLGKNRLGFLRPAEGISVRRGEAAVMSWSSAGSSAPGFHAATGRRRGGEGRSPVTYRENPMAYEPPKFCYCNPGRKAPRWISWSGQNPGRRYYACVDAMNGFGCGYVEWHDPPLPRFVSDLIGDLRDEVWKLRAGQTGGPLSEEQAGREARLEALEEEVKKKTAEIASVQAKYENVVVIFIVFVFGLVAGKILMQ